MKPISKQDLLKLIDEHLPDDAMVAGFSYNMEEFELTADTIAEIFQPVSDMDPDDCIAGSSHIMVTV